MYYAGIDIGSTTTKAVVIDEAEEICGFHIMDTLVNQSESSEIALKKILEKKNINLTDVEYIGATGYGRKVCRVKNIEFPEIICHGIGTKLLIPETRSIIDIGGQDSKVIELDERGKVIHFEMNDKCAAGTGRFFEVLSNRLLKIPMDELSNLIKESEKPVQISSICTIFAETEIISYLAQGIKKEDIATGMCYAIAKRIINMAKAGQVSLKEKIVFTGGAAKNEGLKEVFETILKRDVLLVNDPQITAAYGAAAMARRVYQRNRKEMNI